jgi:acetyltransferase
VWWLLLTDGSGVGATSLHRVFCPRRIALVGASEQPGKTGTLIWRNLTGACGFPGEVIPVTTAAPTVAGRRAYPSLRAVEGEVDLAVIVVPAASVPEVIRDAAAAAIPAAVVISGGFAETGAAGRALQDEQMSAAPDGGVRIVGPNCFGVQNFDLPLNASLAAGAVVGGGGVSLVTQSGAYGMAIHTVALEEQLRFAKVYAAGNEADITDAEVLEYLRVDDASRVLCFFLESLVDGRGFYEQARLAARWKPVIVTKTAASTAGARAALSHTAALAGSHDVARAALAQAGVVECRSGLEMLDAARALAWQPAPAGPRVGIVTNSGGTGVELVDHLAEQEVDVPELSTFLQEALAPQLPAHGSPRNPVDITPVWSRYGELYPALIEQLALSGEVDVVIPVLLQRAALDERTVTAIRDVVGRLRARGVDVPVHVCWVAPREADAHRALLQEAGIPCFSWPERTARAVAHAVRYGRTRRSIRPAEPATPVRWPGRPALGSGILDPEEGARLLAAGGVPTIGSAICFTPDEAIAAADGMGFPVVAKVVHPSILHKTDVGGVVLGLTDISAVRSAALRLLHLAGGARVLIQQQIEGVELIIGGLRDPQFGPTVMAGLGGVLVEALHDVAFALAPLDHREAIGLLHRLRGRAVLAGSRGRAAVDLDAVASLVCAVGRLMESIPEIASLDINPVLATPTACVAVDWRIEIGVEESLDLGLRHS